MAQELNLDQLSDAMRKQQEGNTNGKRVVWDRNSMTFVELNSNEQANDTLQSCQMWLSLILNVVRMCFFENPNITCRPYSI